jgi:hypothetical protein
MNELERDDEKRVMLEVVWIITQRSVESMRLAAERICELRSQQMSPYMEKWTVGLIELWAQIWDEMGKEWMRRMTRAGCPVAAEVEGEGDEQGS